MALGDPMVSTIPVVGTSGTGYATQVNEFLEEVKDRLESQVPLSAVLVSLLDMQNNPIQNVQYLGLYPQSSTPTDPVGSIQFYLGDFYLVTSSGAVQLTSGGTINASAVAGITGDYGGINPAQWRYVTADETYYGYKNYALGQWAYVQGREFKLTGAATGSATLSLAWTPGASYTITFPAAPPASTSVVQMSSSGGITASNTVPALTSTDFRFTGARTRVYHAADAFYENSQTVHPTYGYWIEAWRMHELGGYGPAWTQTNIATALKALYFPVTVESGETITGFAVKAIKNSNTTQIFTASLYKAGFGGAGPVLVSTASVSTNTSGAPLSISIGNTGLTEVVSGSNSYYIKLDMTLQSNNEYVLGATSTHTRP